MTKQIIFIDESGDPGFDFEHGASRYFTLGIIIFSVKKDALEMEDGIKKLRDKLHKKELKFSKATQIERNTYLHEINKYPFYSKVLVVDKELIINHFLRTKPRNFYNFFLKQILEHSKIKDAKVILDGKGNKHFIKELKSYLRKAATDQIKDFTLKDSEKEVLLQVADIVTGAVAWGFKNNNRKYTELIDKEKLNIWRFE